MNIARLLNVAKALRESPNPDNFSMLDYMNGCGTPACALGHYAARPDLQDFMHPVQLIESPVSEYALEYNDEQRALSLDYWDTAIQKHFDISPEEATDLFCSEGCGNAETAIEAAEYIEKMCRIEEMFCKESEGA